VVVESIRRVDLFTPLELCLRHRRRRASRSAFVRLFFAILFSEE